MKIQLEIGAGRNLIRSYGPGRIVINQQAYGGSVIITPAEVVSDWRPRLFSDLTDADFERIITLDPEVILLGTGRRLQFAPPSLTRPLVAAQIGFEVMDTGAACRTYNVLMSEGRRVAAALLPIE